jgi:hypothetical protein
MTLITRPWPALAILLSVLLALPLFACGGSSHPKPTPTATTQTAAAAATTPTAPPTATSSPRIGPTNINLGEAAAPPGGSSLFTVTGCSECDGPDETLQRHDVGPTGSLTTFTMLRSGEGVLDGWTIGQLGAVPDASMLWAVTCRTSYCGALGNSHPKDTWSVFWSFDRGASWSVAFREEVAYTSVMSAADGRLLVETVTPGGPPATIRFYAVDRAGSTEIHAPQSAGQFPEPQLLAGGTVVWLGSPDASGARSRLFRADGSDLALASGLRNSIAYDAVFQTSGGQLFVGVLDRSTALHGFDLYATLGGSLVASYQIDGAYRFAPLTDRFVLSNVTGDRLGLNDISYPVLVDLDRLSATPFVAGIFTQQRGRNRFVAFVPAP